MSVETAPDYSTNFFGFIESPVLPIKPRAPLHRRPSVVFPVPKLNRDDRASVSSIPKIIQVKI